MILVSMIKEQTSISKKKTTIRSIRTNWQTKRKLTRKTLLVSSKMKKIKVTLTFMITVIK